MNFSNMNEYPTEKELTKIEMWDTLRFGIIELVKYVGDIWKYADIEYFKFTGDRVLKLELHTGGWSGNEDIISSLKSNTMFWMICWQKSVRGGHYYFKWNKKQMEKP